MPPKRRTMLGRSSSAASRMAVYRASESSQERNTRLTTQQARQATSRAAEDSEEQEARLIDQRTRQATARAAESSQEQQARLANQRTRQATLRAARYDHNNDYETYPLFDIGNMSSACVYRSALKWTGEAPGMCCSNGRVKLSPLTLPPEPLESLMSGTTTKSKQFLENIRKYNSCFQMTSFGTTNEVCEPGFMPTFKVQGQVYHRVGSPLPPPNKEHQFLQIYFMGDEQKEADRRCKNIPGT